MPEGEQRRAAAATRPTTAGRPARTSGSRGSLHVFVTDSRGQRFSAGGLSAWLRRVAPRRARGTVTVALVGDHRVRALNRTYRRKDYATDVLSFPSGERTLLRHSPDRQSQMRYLGDIVIARGVARRQAAAAGHSEDVELKVLALHGLLHLLGYDHERDGGRMRRLEQRLRRKGGLREGLIERAAGERQPR
jgi:probable rRNA maturation factor